MSHEFPPSHGSHFVQGPTRSFERFAQDREWFDDNGGMKRRQLVRSAHSVEFPGFNAEHHGNAILWVAVQRFNAATHVIVPVWFGYAFFDVHANGALMYATAPNDDDIAAIVSSCAERGNFDPLLWRSRSQASD